MTAAVKSVYWLLLNRVPKVDVSLVHVGTEAQRQALVGLAAAPGQGYLLWRPAPWDG